MEIKLSQGKVATVDKEDFEWLRRKQRKQEDKRSQFILQFNKIHIWEIK